MFTANSKGLRHNILFYNQKLSISYIRDYLKEKLHLELHPDKISIKTLNSGVDFLGWVNFSDHRVLRTATKKRMFIKIGKSLSLATINSYLGLLKHGNTYRIGSEIAKNLK